MSSSPNSSSSSDIDVAAAFPALLDVTVPLDIILGTGMMSVRQCLTLDRNSVVRLDQSAGVDLQLLANGISLAKGEVVIVEDSTAIRVTDIEEPPGGGAGA